ncbi:MAG: hypothetical protein Q9211_003356, partial [Gyalolechia sp. 1 TL-2023]
MEFDQKLEDDSEHFWKVEADDHEFWDAYIASRPNYSQAFYQIIHDYHSKHSSDRDLAHDVGCGTGRVAAELATYYTHVVASDVDADHLNVAKTYLTAVSGKISYAHSKAEDLASYHPESSVDLIATAETVVFIDTDAGLASFSKILKPGGTFAAWFYGRPTFSDRALFTAAQPILDKIMDRSWTTVIGRNDSGPKRALGFKRCADAMESWLDFLPFPQETWTDVQRYKWNTHGKLAFFGETACGYKIRPVSNIADGEKVVVKEDLDFWKNEWNVAEVKKYFRVLFPGFRKAIGEDDAVTNGLFEELGEAMGGE